MPRPRRLPWKRTLAALALGAASTLTTAWWIAWNNPHPNTMVALAGGPLSRPVSPTSGPVRSWQVIVSRGPGVRTKVFTLRTDPPPTQEQFLASMHVADEARYFDSFTSDPASRAAMRRHAHMLDPAATATPVEFTVHIYGWPLPCMASERAYTAADAQYKQLMSVFDGPGTPTQFPSPGGNSLNQWYAALNIHDHILPTRPLPLPFALSAATFAAAWLTLIFAVPPLLKRSRRPGTCQACHYNLAGLPDGTPCPECGSRSPKNRA